MPRSFRHLELSERVFIETQFEPGDEAGRDRCRSEASPVDH